MTRKLTQVNSKHMVQSKFPRQMGDAELLFFFYSIFNVGMSMRSGHKNRGASQCMKIEIIILKNDFA